MTPADELPLFPDGHRDGRTYEPRRDFARLNAQARRVARAMLDREWHTLAAISKATGDPEASVSARIRDFRKECFGGHTVERRYVEDGLHEYRLTVNPQQRWFEMEACRVCD